MTFARTYISCAIFSIISASIYANDKIPMQSNDTEKSSVQLSPLVLKAAEDKQHIGQTIYTKEDIEKTPNSSKNITDFLKVNPNVQFSNKAKNGLQQGELTPSDISINGGMPYENKYLINGMSVNNNINPIGSKESNDPTNLMGTTQTVAVNTDLLCDITLLDSNVSAEYGEFTGGVVSAETCKPKTEVGKIHGNISYDYTTDSWSKINFPDSDSLEDFENSNSEKNQPYFTKQGLSTNIYGNLTDTLGFNAYGSYRHSAIPLKTNLNEPKNFEQTRESHNGGLEFFYTQSDTTELKVGAQFFENKGLYFKEDILNSESTHVSDSKSIYVDLKNKLDTVTLKQHLNYQSQNASREAADNLYIWAKSDSKNWNSKKASQQEGNLGDLAQEEKKLEYNVTAEFTPIETHFLTHTFKVGAGLGHYEANSSRANNTYSYASLNKPQRAENCIDNGLELEDCDPSTGQVFDKRKAYYAHNINIEQNRWNAFIQDSMHYKNYVSSTIGVRFDYDSLTQNNNIAPRTSFNYKPFGNNRLTFTTGWNRYYGLNSFSNELSDRLDQYQKDENRVSENGHWTNEWKPDANFGNINYRSKLKSPYSDETVFAVQTQFANTNVVLKWVGRDNKDQIKTILKIKDPKFNQKNTYHYDNSGLSTSDIYTLSINNITPIHIANSSHRFNLALDYTKTTRNFTDYTSSSSNTPEVIYDGEKISSDFIPASNYNTPWTARLSWDIGFDHLPLTISNFFSYKAAADAMKVKYKVNLEDGIYDVYTPYETKPSFSWDMRTSYTIPSTKNTQTILGLTINNLTNHKNEYLDTGIAKPEIGRQFIADITFKF